MNKRRIEEKHESFHWKRIDLLTEKLEEKKTLDVHV